MPVFLDDAGPERNSRVNPVLAPALPHLGDADAALNAKRTQNQYDVVIVGVRFSSDAFPQGSGADIFLRLVQQVLC
jgi:hypothetical protein